MILHLIALLVLHYVADFLLQTRKMGQNKSKSLMWLSIHVGVYLIALLSFGLLFGHYVVQDPNDMYPIFEYCLLNATLHWLTDFGTSKLSGYFYMKYVAYKQKDEDAIADRYQYKFWATIGFDQLVHGVTLLLTYYFYFVK